MTSVASNIWPARKRLNPLLRRMTWRAISDRPHDTETAALIRRLPELLTFEERRVAKVAARLKTAGKDGR